MVYDPDTLALLNVTINGEARQLSAPITVADLVHYLHLDTRKVAIERNEAIVSKSLYETTSLQDGDVLEIVHFIGGG